MRAAPMPYDQPIKAHYEEILARYLQRKNEMPPIGWQRAVLHLPPDAARVEPREQDRFMEELLRLIREQCSTTNPKETSPQGLWIEKFDGSEVVNKYLRGGKLKLYPGESVPQPVWIDVALIAGPWPGSGFFTT
jgi:hypothetical protein